ncbi:MAG: serine/threonine-protein kinase [Streptosporangiaceae bacterium]
MGVVWRAYDETLDRDVAIKEIVFPAGIPQDEQRLACARSVQEARAAGRLNHPGVITVHDVVEHDRRPWIVMELFRGGSLADLIDQAGPLPPRRVAEIGLCVLDALCAAHAAGIVHRDIKPANVLVNSSRVVLTDFGAAAIQNDAALTRSGFFIGTPAYMAPERAQHVRASPASDLWSLGATLYAAVEGRPPYTGLDSLAVLSALLTSDPPSPSRAGPLALVLTGLMCRDMGQRLTAERTKDLLAKVVGSVADLPLTVRTPTEPDAGLHPSQPSSWGGQSTRTSFPRPYTSSPPASPAARAARVKPASRTRRRGLRGWLVAGVALLVTSGVLIATKIAAGPPLPPLTETTRVYIATTNASIDTFSTPVYKSSCAPSKSNPHGCSMDMDIYYLKNMRWISWNQTEAVGVGTAVTQGCVPVNAQSCRITDTLISIPGVKFTFSDPVDICGRYYWSHMLAHYPPNAPSDLRAYDHLTRFPLSSLGC